MKLIIRWVITILALFIAAQIVPGIRVQGNAWITFAVVAVILGLVNAIVRPILRFLTCPLIVLTLGLFLLVINGVTLWISAWLSQQVYRGGAFYVDGFVPALLGALIVSAVTVIGSMIFKEEKD